MPENAQITFVPGTIPEGFCPQNVQELFNTFSEFLSGYLPGNFSSFNYGDSEPTVDNQSLPWIRTNADGSLDRLYVFSGGSWISPHPIPIGPNSLRQLWVGTPASLQTFEGGDAGVITDRTGSFYEIDSDFVDKIPIGAGAVAAVGVNASVLTAGAGVPQVRGIHFIKRSLRRFYVA